MGQSPSNIKSCKMGAKLAGLENDLDLPSFCVYDWELMMGLEMGHLKVSKNVKFQDLSHNVA